MRILHIVLCPDLQEVVWCHKSKRVESTSAYWQVDVAVINSYILSRYYTDLNIKDVKTFRTELAKGLIGEYSSRKRSGRHPTRQSAKRFCSAHVRTNTLLKVFIIQHWPICNSTLTITRLQHCKPIQVCVTFSS